MEPNDLLLSTDFEIVKIIGYQTGSAVVPSFGFNDQVLPHTFGFAPLYSLKWSTTPDFSVSYQETGLAGNDILVASQTNSTASTIILTNNSSSSVTIYYQLIYFIPFDQNATINPTQPDLDDFFINTDYSYSAIYAEGYLPATGGTFEHNLGYIPQIDAWSVDNLGVKRRFLGSEMPNLPQNVRLLVTPTTLTWINNPATSFLNWQMYFRIYGAQV